jgi:hypothetical protein
MKHSRFYSKSVTLPRILAEKSNDSDIIEFLSELEMLYEDDDDDGEDCSQPVTRKHREPLKLELDVFDDHDAIEDISLQKKNRFKLYTGTFSLEDDEEVSIDESFDGCFFSFATKDEPSASKSIDRSSLLMDILNMKCSPLYSSSRSKSGNMLSCISTPFACQDKVEENLAVPFQTDFDNRIPKTLVLTESILVDDEHFIGTSVVVGLSHELDSKKQDEQLMMGDTESKNSSSTVVEKIKGLCATGHIGGASDAKLTHLSPFACLVNGDVKSIISDLASLVANNDDTSLVSEVEIDSVSSIEISTCEEEARYSDKSWTRDALLQEPDDYTENDDMVRENPNQEESGKLLNLNAFLKDKYSSPKLPLGNYLKIVEEIDEEDDPSSTINTSDKYIPSKARSHDVFHPVDTNEKLPSQRQIQDDTSPSVHDMNCSRFLTSEGRLNTYVKQKLQERRLFREKVLLSLDE